MISLEHESHSLDTAEYRYNNNLIELSIFARNILIPPHTNVLKDCAEKDTVDCRHSSNEI